MNFKIDWSGCEYYIADKTHDGWVYILTDGSISMMDSQSRYWFRSEQEATEMLDNYNNRNSKYSDAGKFPYIPEENYKNFYVCLEDNLWLATDGTVYNMDSCSLDKCYFKTRLEAIVATDKYLKSLKNESKPITETSTMEKTEFPLFAISYFYKKVVGYMESSFHGVEVRSANSVEEAEGLSLRELRKKYPIEGGHTSHCVTGIAIK